MREAGVYAGDRAMTDGIREDLLYSFGLNCREIRPVTGGWMNEKWRVTTDSGEFLVKRFSMQRFSMEKIQRIEAALKRQAAVHAAGVRCPRILLHENRVIRILDENTAYMVMEFCAGRVETVQTITIPQLRSLGEACGLMHKAFLQLSQEAAEGYPIDDQHTIDLMWENYRERERESEVISLPGYREAVLALRPILEGIDAAFFARLPKSVAHEDFSPDNMLFRGDELAAILDFDRNHYHYRWHDIGRAILSLALVENRLAMDRVEAFRAGYTAYLPLTLQNIADALRLTWCVEIAWWIRPEFFEKSHQKVERFRDEILWMTAHWQEIDGLLGQHTTITP